MTLYSSCGGLVDKHYFIRIWSDDDKGFYGIMDANFVQLIANIFYNFL